MHIDRSRMHAPAPVDELTNNIRFVLNSESPMSRRLLRLLTKPGLPLPTPHNQRYGSRAVWIQFLFWPVKIKK